MVVVPKDYDVSVGSPAHEAGRERDERQRQASVSAAFAVGIYEVTLRSGTRAWRMAGAATAPRTAVGDEDSSMRQRAYKGAGLVERCCL